MDAGFDQIRNDIEIMQGNIILGQDALGDAIAENGESIGEMREELAEMKNILLENQDMLQEMLNGYTQDKQSLIGLDQDHEKVYNDFKGRQCPDGCWPPGTVYGEEPQFKPAACGCGNRDDGRRGCKNAPSPPACRTQRGRRSTWS